MIIVLLQPGDKKSFRARIATATLAKLSTYIRG